jgi:predicted ATP-grasp superfamily ATP-dependent carboligase
VLAVAAVSARMLAEAAARDGHEVIALDLFGDADTRRASARWLPIGEPPSLRIDAACVLAALDELARRGDVIGWVAGSGFEGQAALLEAGAQRLPLIGTAPRDVQRVRDPAAFFATLAAQGIAHPEVRSSRPVVATGWLLKDAHACGGWHIRRLRDVNDTADFAASWYFQREAPGVPMSATFIANGHDARLIGINAQGVRRFGTRPYAFCGVIGPVELAAGVAQHVADAVARLTRSFELRGWCGLDFLLDGDDVAVLEVNPRPPASLSLYGGQGAMNAQIEACLRGDVQVFAAGEVGGIEVVYARRSLRVGPEGARALAEDPHVHDLPAAGASFTAGDPVCSLSARGRSADEVKALLSARRDAWLNKLETTT